MMAHSKVKQWSEHILKQILQKMQMTLHLVSQLFEPIATEENKNKNTYQVIVSQNQEKQVLRPFYR